VALACAIAFVAPVFGSGGADQGGSALPDGPLLPWTGEEVVFEGFGSDLGMEDKPDFPVVQAYRKMTGNVRINWDTVPWNDYDTKLNLYLQSGDMPDIVWARDTPGKTAMFGGTGVLLDWDQYKDRMPNYQRYTKEFPFVDNVVTAKGERFAIVDIPNAEYIGEGWFYNPEILAKAGINSPPDTMDELLEDMIAVKKAAPDADGFLEQWGMGRVLGAFGSAMDVKRGVGYDQDLKKWIYGPTQDPEYRNYIEYLRKAWQAGVFNLDTLGDAIVNERVQELRRQGNYAFTYIYYGAVKSANLWENEEAPVVGMRTPAYKGRRYYWITVPHDRINGWGFMASKKTKNPELLAAYVDNIVSPEVALLYDWGVEGVTYRVNSDGSKEWIGKYADDRTARRAAGVGNFWDPRYIHLSNYKDNWFGLMLTDPPGGPGRIACAEDILALQRGEMEPRFSHQRPQMTNEVNDEIGKIMTPINTFVDEQVLKFINGDRPMSEFSDFIAQIKTLGDIDKVVRYYNEGRQFPMGERKYPDVPADLR
jgi:putative aldouronate transport system substrate-binding protein